MEVVGAASDGEATLRRALEQAWEDGYAACARATASQGRFDLCYRPWNPYHVSRTAEDWTEGSDFYGD